MGTRYYALHIIGHDGLHRRIFNDVMWNDLFNNLFILGPIGSVTRLNNKNHLAHHRFLATEEDPDRHKYGCFNKARTAHLLMFASGLTSVWLSTRNVFFPKVQPERDPAQKNEEPNTDGGTSVFLPGGSSS